MTGLAEAMVGLGASAEKRRDSRRALRESAEVVVNAILKYTRVGDVAWLDQPGGGVHVYVVERVAWEEEQSSWGNYEPGVVNFHRSDTRPALVQYCFPAGSHHDDYTFVSEKTYDGGVLSDVRVERKLYSVTNDPDDPFEVSGSAKPRGTTFFRQEPANANDRYDTSLHLATDRELTAFAREAAEVVQELSRSLRGEAETFTQSADLLTKLTLK